MSSQARPRRFIARGAGTNRVSDFLRLGVQGKGQRRHGILKQNRGCCFTRGVYAQRRIRQQAPLLSSCLGNKVGVSMIIPFEFGFSFGGGCTRRGLAGAARISPNRAVFGDFGSSPPKQTKSRWSYSCSRPSVRSRNRPFGSILRKHLHCGPQNRYTGGRCNTDVRLALAAMCRAVGVVVCMLHAKGPMEGYRFFGSPCDSGV